MKRFAVKMTITNNEGLTRIGALTNYLKETENFFRHNCKILKMLGTLVIFISIVQNVDEYNARF